MTQTTAHSATDTAAHKMAFVTGATGFLGRHLCRQLVAANWQVTAMCRSIPENALEGVNYVTADLLDPASLEAAVPAGVDAIFHTAADTNTWRKNNPRQIATNVGGTHNLINAAEAQGAKRWVHVSSITTYGVDHEGMIDLDDDSEQHGLDSWVNYVQTKSQAERLVKNHTQALNVVVVNPTHIIGPDDQHNWIRLFKMMINDALPTVPVGAGSFVDVRDVAAGCIQAAEQGQVGANYILGGHNLNFDQFIDAVAKAFDLTVTKRRKPMGLIKLVAQLQSRFAYLTGKEPDLTPESLQIISHEYRTDSPGAKQDLGYVITPLDQTLNDIKVNLTERGIL
ncbi:NAD-dependent epimerase/dehydratase family protein [Marinicella meishanensis]|uniref:NAD-dependent epimerase/dehydratase family protein n=1 Tax=Marinicella meishanensis TaxID=2873263 RepID=UPI001CBF5C24|nr:NAD-dependent epimerase/dehydratase family protein [Marinicella sp. NBU2979]